MFTAALKLSAAEQRTVFCQVTRALPQNYGDAIVRGMSDAELIEALKATLGIFGGSCGPDCLSVAYQGAGLKIWGGRHIVNPMQEKPLFAGAKTIATARLVYDIHNPDDPQMTLF